MYGKKVEFMPWGKMPLRDPTERIARVGQGFSKMLSMIQPDQLSRFEQKQDNNTHTNFYPNQMQASDQFGDIRMG